MVIPKVGLTLLIGSTTPKQASRDLIENLKNLEVTHSDEGHSGFQIVFEAGRAGKKTGLNDYSLLTSNEIKPFNRVVILMTIRGKEFVLMDGVISNHQLSPGKGPGEGILTITGEDLSLLMDLEEKTLEHPSQNEADIATRIIGQYSKFGIKPKIERPPSVNTPTVTERIPIQQGTDRAYLSEMAARFGYVFYISPGPTRLNSEAYWGPPNLRGRPQSPLIAGIGPQSNVDAIQFQYDSLKPKQVEIKIQDRQTNDEFSIVIDKSTRPPLVSEPAWNIHQEYIRKDLIHESGLNITQAQTIAQGYVDSSMDRVVTASGTLDGLRYGALLVPRGLVGLKGVGVSYDGLYYVKSVTYSIKRGEFKQNFILTREGIGAIPGSVVT